MKLGRFNKGTQRDAMRKAYRYAMPKRVRSSAKKDLVQFAIPGIAVFVLELSLIVRDAPLRGFWVQLWGMISHPSSMADLPALTVAGMFLFIIGLTIMCWGQLTLYKNYSGTVVIHEGHELVTRGIYNYVRNPMYFGLIIGVCFGLPAFGLSIRGFLVSLLLVPILLNRIRLEEELLTEHFQDEYLQYKARTKRLIPFVY
jgi:protein-S-isoprenylcysteine O-methyltransferase Ste14